MIAPRKPPALPPTLAGSAYIGWLRKAAGHWQPVVGADSRGDCWDRLLYVPGGLRSERMVLPAGARP